MRVQVQVLAVTLLIKLLANALGMAMEITQALGLLHSCERSGQDSWFLCWPESELSVVLVGM